MKRMINVKKVLAIGAHPDDVEFGCGGSLAKHILNGDKVYVLFLTRGEEGGDPNLRVKEALKALKILRVPKSNIFFSDLPDTRIFEHLKEAIEIIEEKVKEIEPNIVYTTDQNDRHQDHIATGIASNVACRRVESLFAYETPSSLMQFSPQVFIDISSVLNLKIKALKSHKSQEGKHYMRANAIRGLAIFRGLQANLPAAEAFKVYRLIYY